MIWSLALLALATQVLNADDRVGERDFKSLVPQLTTFKSDATRGADFLRATKIAVVEGKGKDAELKLSSAKAFLADVAGCAPGKPRGGEAWNKDGTSEFVLEWTCSGSKELFGTIQMRDGKIIYMHWGSAPVVLMPSAG